MIDAFIDVANEADNTIDSAHQADVDIADVEVGENADRSIYAAYLGGYAPLVEPDMLDPHTLNQ